MPTEQLANCWLQARALPAEAIAVVRRQVHCEVHPFEDAPSDGNDSISLMANTTFSEKFEEVRPPEQNRAVRRWLAVEDDVEAIEETMGMVMREVDEGMKTMLV